MLTRIFRTLSRIRGKRIFHPVGSTYAGRISLNDTSKEILGNNLPAETNVIVRVSRAFNLTGIKSDFYGIAVRLQVGKEYQDLLFASAGNGPITKYFFKPTATRLSNTFSMDLPYKIRNKRYLFWLKLDKKITFDHNSPSIPPDAKFVLQVSRLVGRRRRLGTIRIGEQLKDATNESISYNPWHTLYNIKPVGIINWLRKNAYAQSQIGRQ